jgi:hypothetical protein
MFKIIFLFSLFLSAFAYSDVGSKQPLYAVATTKNDKAPKPLVISVTGVGASKLNTVSHAHSLALARRAAITDAYRQLTEYTYGVNINGRDLIRDMIVKNSRIRSYIQGVLREARITNTTFINGLCEVEMEIVIYPDVIMKKII